MSVDINITYRRQPGRLKRYALLHVGGWVVDDFGS